MYTKLALQDNVDDVDDTEPLKRKERSTFI